ncbi:MAG: hypothetical protein ABI614_15480, partial [Planctomycetota bacterium]
EDELDGGNPFGFGSIDVLPPDLDIDLIIDTMPPELKRQMKQAAAATGLSIQETIQGILGMGIAEELKAQTKSHRRGQTPQSNQTTFGFPDDE